MVVALNSNVFLLVCDIILNKKVISQKKNGFFIFFFGILSMSTDVRLGLPIFYCHLHLQMTFYELFSGCIIQYIYEDLVSEKNDKISTYFYDLSKM